MSSSHRSPGMYELAVEWSERPAPTALTEISRIIQEHKCYKTIDVNTITEGRRVPVSQARSAEDLHTLSTSLERVGGKTTITKLDTPRYDPVGFERFYFDYTRRLSVIMEQLPLAPLHELVNALLAARDQRKRIYVFGNGGSASTASHFANDFSKRRFSDPSRTFRVMSLTDNMSWISATANDEGYDRVFINQLQNHMDEGDIVIAISSSGNSPNIVRAIEWANANGATSFGVVGFSGGELARVAHHSIHIPTKVGQYGFHEDVSMVLTHVLSVFLFEHDRADQCGGEG